jgi:N-ethylmaleimide reductase
MTRNRATGNIPNQLMAEYYAQRGSAGLIITEGTSPSPNGLGYPRIPGIFSAEQVAGWKRITDAVHAKGAKMFIQFMHCGRVAHPLNLPAGARVLGPSAIAAAGDMYTDAEGLKPNAMPQAMTEDCHRGSRPSRKERDSGRIRRYRTARGERLLARAVHPPELESAHRPLRRLDR